MATKISRPLGVDHYEPKNSILQQLINVAQIQNAILNELRNLPPETSSGKGAVDGCQAIRSLQSEIEDVSPTASPDFAEMLQLLSWRNSLSLTTALFDAVKTNMKTIVRHRGNNTIRPRSEEYKQICSIIDSLHLPTCILYEPKSIFCLASAYHGRVRIRYYTTGPNNSIVSLSSDASFSSSATIALSPLSGIHLICIPEGGAVLYQIMLLVYAHFWGQCATTPDKKCRIWIGQFLETCLSTFTDPWRPLTRAETVLFRHQTCFHFPKKSTDHEDGFVMIWFTLQYFAIDQSTPHDVAVRTGIGLSREQSFVPTMSQFPTEAENELAADFIVEMRDTLLLKFYPSKEDSAFTLLTLSDNVGCPKAWHHAMPREKSAEYRGSLAPMLIFVRLLHEHFNSALALWNQVLGRIETEVELKLSQVADDGYMTKIMFDRISLDRSKFYFKLLQLLRIMHDAVEDTNQHLLIWAKGWSEQLHRQSDKIFCTEHDLHQLLDLWKDVEMNCVEDLTQLRLRIERKQTEIESLRDGLFNATSVREALQAGQTSLSVMVFTLVTVFYLPLQFVTGFFGMDSILANTSLTISTKPFMTMLLVISASTYAFAFVSLRWYKIRKSNLSFRDILQSTSSIFSYQLKSSPPLDDRGDPEALHSSQ